MKFLLKSLLLGLLLVATPVCAETTIPKGIIKLDGSKAPPLVLKNMDGEEYNIEQSRGKWAFIHFWAAWCGPCRREMPTVQKMHDLIKDTPIDIVLINTAEDEDTIFSFLSVVAPNMTTLMDRDGLVTERWQPRGLPATFLVSPQGTLEYIALGGRTWDKPEFLNFIKHLAKQKK